MKAGLLLLSLLVLGTSAQLKDVTTPTILEPIQASTRYFNKGQKDVVVRCRADGQPSYKWLKDGKVVEAIKDKEGKTAVLFDSRSGDLTITKYYFDYDGEYRCIATIGDASSMSQVQTLLQTRIQPFDIGETVKIQAQEYTYKVLKCEGQGLLVVEDIVYNWYVNENKEQIQLDDGRLFIDAKGNLHFTYLTMKDDKRYSCGVSASESFSIVTGTWHELSVTDTDPAGSNPILQYSSQDVQGLVGSEASLECFFSGYNTANPGNNYLPTIQWYDQRDKIVPSAKYEISDDSRVLTIKNLVETDEKHFYCKGSTTNDDSTKDRNAVHLNVTSKPVWVDPPKTETKPEKTDAVFHCNARSLIHEAEPDPPEWFINSKPFHSGLDHHKYVLGPDKKTLTIKNLEKPKDILCVQCIVKNSVGSLMGDACLNVVTPIQITVSPPEEQRIKKGETVNLTVKATSDGDSSNPLNFEWHYKNITYIKPNRPPHVTFDPRNGNTYINTSQLSQDEYDTVGGLYRLKVYDLYDEKIIYVNVKLSDVVPVPVTASASIQMWIIGLIIGIIFLFVVIAIIIFVICRKQLEGDYNVDKKETGAGLDPEKELRDKGFNDLSRPDYDDYYYPDKKPRGDLEYDDVPIGGDDESLGEYGDEEDTHFNEDGSFIGIYQKKENERQNNHAESTI